MGQTVETQISHLLCLAMSLKQPFIDHISYQLPQSSPPENCDHFLLRLFKIWAENTTDCPYFSNLGQGLIDPAHQRKEKVAMPFIPLSFRWSALRKGSKGEVAAITPVLLDIPKMIWGAGRKSKTWQFYLCSSADQHIQGCTLTSTRKDTASVTASIPTMEIRHVVGVQTSWGKSRRSYSAMNPQ